jgi:hypothetical protein
MAIRRQAGSVVLMVPFLLQLLTLTSSERGQTLTEAAQTLPSAASNPATEEQRLRSYVTRVRYTYFLEFVGRENYLVKKETTEIRSDSTERMDYGLAIDISEGQEEVMMSIVLDASPQIINEWDRVDGISMSLLHTQANSSSAYEMELKALMDLAQQTRTNLKRELGAEFIRKLDAYVNREFRNREGPLSLAELSTEQDAHLDGTGTTNIRPYEALFQLMGDLDASGPRGADATKPASTIALQIYIPKDHREAVLAILAAAQLQMDRNRVLGFATIGEYFRAHGPQPIPHPLPSDFFPVRNKYWANVGGNIIQLKRLLGESEFDKFDESVNQVFGVGLSVAALN